MLTKNEQKYIKSLKIKKFRMQEKSFLVEGAKNVRELLKADFTCELLVASNDFIASDLMSVNNIRIEEVKPALITSLGTFGTNTSAVAVVKMKDAGTIKLDGVNFMLDGISDPGNMGTIIRTLDWFGFDQVICSPDTTDFYQPKVINSTMGSFTRVNVFYRELEEVLANYHGAVYGAYMEGENLFKSKVEDNCLIVLGSESHGISPRLANYTKPITIPGHGLAESLNVGVATGIIASYLRNS